MTADTWPFWKTIPRFDREYCLGDLFQAVCGPTAAEGEDATWLESILSPGAGVHFARSGRECLYLILKILGLRPNSRVGVPLYCCASVFEAIVAAGHIPLFLDADPSTYGLSEEHLHRNRDQLDALVVVHTFGYPADLGRIRTCLRGRYVPIVEDCAHALFSEYQKHLAGTYTEASFFSFGMHKPAAIGGGAALLVNDPSLAKATAREIGRLRPESRSLEIGHSLKCWARSISYQRAAYGALLSSPLGRHRDDERRGSNDQGVHAPDGLFPPCKMRLVDRVLLRQRIEEFQQKLPGLAVNTEKIRKATRGGPPIMPAEPVHGKWNHFLLPVRYRTSGQRALGRSFLLRRRIDTAPLYQNCARNARLFGYSGGCENAEHVAQTICTVPNHPWLKDDEITYIGESLRSSADLDFEGRMELEFKSERAGA